MGRAQLRILTIGECAAVLPLVARVSAMGPRLLLLQSATPEDLILSLQSCAPDVLIVDADCTRFSAPTICAILKEHPVARLWPLFVASCSARACDDALAAGADDFLTPQIPPRVLSNRLHGLAQLSLAGRIAGVPAHLRPEIQGRAVVLSAGLRGYSRISQSMSAPDLVPLLNEYLTLLTVITHRHRGMVFRMAEDALLAGFGLPGQQSDGPEPPVRAAQEMLIRFAELARVWREHSHLGAGLAIGLHEGPVAAATIGSPLFVNDTLVGDAVDVARRLCRRARAGEIVFAASFARTLEESGVTLHAAQLPPVSLHDHTAPADIFCVPLQKRLNLTDRALHADQRLLRHSGR